MADRGEQVAGKAKETLGKATGDENLESEGRTQDQKERTKQSLGEAQDKVKGAVAGAKEKLEEK